MQASSITKSHASHDALQSSVTSSIDAEVKNLNEEVSYLTRLQKLTEVSILHLRVCCSALDQCIKVHNDEHLGHVQLWELLNQWRIGSNLSSSDRSRLKHICRQYLEKVSSLLLLAGIPVKSHSPSFDAISKNIPRIKHTAFYDQMLYHFKDSWGASGRTWADSIHASFTPSWDTSNCCCGNLDFLGPDWTRDAGILFQDVLGRLYDHSCGLFPQGTKNVPNAKGLKPDPKPDPIKQAGVLKLINAFKGSLDFTTISACECLDLYRRLLRSSFLFSAFVFPFQTFFFSYFSYIIADLPNWDCASPENRNFLSFPDISNDFGIFASSTPCQFLENLRRLLHEVHESLSSDMVSSASLVQTIHNLQDAILFMSERDVDGKDSSSPGILQILRYEWTGVPEPPLADRPQKPGLAGDLETTHRLVEQRLKTCYSKILTLTGKQKRAQLIRDDPRSAYAPRHSIYELLVNSTFFCFEFHFLLFF